jgi:TonB family protein
VICALAAHAGVAYALAHVRLPEKTGPSVVEVDVRKREPLPPPKIETPPEPPKPEPERKVVQKEKKIAPPPATPPPNKEPPKETPKEVKPVFGVTMDSTTEGDSSMAVNVGNTTMIDPKKSAKDSGDIKPLPASPQAPAKPSYEPKSDVYIKSQPEIDGEACARVVKYTDEAEQLGIEGQVTLRIELDEKGGVHSIKVLKGLGHGLDQRVMEAFKNARECHFYRPAYGTDGKPAAYALTYKFNFELQR